MTIQKFNFVCNLLIYNQGGMWLIINIERRNERYKNITMKRYENIYDETKRKEQNVMGTSVTSRSVVKPS